MMPQTLSSEAELRQRLGVPADARQVLIFAESSHWDPNWLRTSEEYYRLVEPNLDQAIEALEREPRRIYSVECMFFLRMYWERRPDRRAALRELVNAGRMRLTGSGVTTADTIIPPVEALLRDFLLGQEWLRANGMTVEPRLAYFTDSFGVTPALPSLLRAAGFDRTAITRIDGMYFAGADYESERGFPRAGSSAEHLLKHERSLDFIWRDAAGAEALCHWNAFTYGQGDMLAHRGVARLYLVPLALPDRSDAFVARRIAGYITQLAPLSRTPYLFCPIGFDFVAPIPDLVALLDRYNQNHYPTSGVWTVNAGLDDYLALVDCYRDRLPVVALDPNPYWTGFYTARPSLKQQYARLVESLTLAERLSLHNGLTEQARGTAHALTDAWWDATAANHHDFVTGTSPDRVVAAEQRPWLDRATADAEAALTRLAQTLPRPAVSAGVAALPEWRHEAGRVEVRTPFYQIVLDERRGGAIVAWDDADGKPLLRGIGNDLVAYRDSGGLWRMGHEFRGGRFEEIARASDRAASLTVSEYRGGLEVGATVVFGGEPVTRRMLFRNDTQIVRMRVEGRAAPGLTLTARFVSGVDADAIVMDVAGGVVTRPARKIYNPTFWPLQSFAHLTDRVNGDGVALCVGRSGAFAVTAGGTLELVTLRNATGERAFGVVPIPATPANGDDRFTASYEYALGFTRGADWRAAGIPLLARELVDSPWDAEARGGVRQAAAAIATTDRADIVVSALKCAARGAGVIVRLQALHEPGGEVTLRFAGSAPTAAVLCDARERDLAPLEVSAGAVRLTMTGTIATVRLLID